MKLGSPVRTTRKPLTAPSAAQSAKVKSAATHSGQPQYSAGIASIMPAKPIIEPMERSNSPPIMRSAAPTAMMPRNAATVAQLTMPSALNMPESPATTKKTAKTSTAPEMEPNSGRDRNRRSGPISRTRSSDGADGALAVAAGVEISGPVMTALSRGSAILPGVLLHLGDVFLRDETRTRRDVAVAVDGRQAVFGEALLRFGVCLDGVHDLLEVRGLHLLHGREHSHRDVALQVGLLIDRELNGAGLDSFADVVREVEGRHPELACLARLLQGLDRRARGSGGKRQHAVGVRILAQVRRDLRFDRRRVVARVEGGFLVIDADHLGEAATALETRRVGRVVVDAEEALHAGRLGALARALPRRVLRLADVHDGAQLFALLHRTRIDRD